MSLVGCRQDLANRKRDREAERARKAIQDVKDYEVYRCDDEPRRGLMIDDAEFIFLLFACSFVCSFQGSDGGHIVTTAKRA